MKTLIQLFLFFTIIIFCFFFYKNYFAINKNENELAIINEKFENLDKAEKSVADNIDKKEKINKEIKSKIAEKTQKANSSIQNLSYKVKLPDNNEYEIVANSSELRYKNNQEIILMNNVVARFIDKDNKIIKIEADEAIFNNGNYSIFELLKEIHPTPAICGVPWNNALQFIKELEDHSRGFFAGVIGWFNFESEAEFAVAIRSALIKNKELYAFAGCGIVKGSDPIDEFEETKLKLNAILSILNHEKIYQS